MYDLLVDPVALVDHLMIEKLHLKSIHASQ